MAPALDALESAFRSGSGALVRVQGDAWGPMDVVFLDMDGVITKECEYFEKAWALLIRQLIALDADAALGDLTEADIAKGAAFRKRTKGAHQNAASSARVRPSATQRWVHPGPQTPSVYPQAACLWPGCGC